MSEPKTNPKNNGEQSATGSFRFEKQILNTSSIGVLITRISDGTILYANKAITSLLGFAMGDSVIGRPVPDFYWDSADGQKMLDLFRTEGSVTSNEMRARQADGNMIWVSISLQPFQFEGEQSLLAEIVDVTERKQAENAVKASQQKLSLLIDSSPLAVIEWNTNFEVVSWNPAAERIFGYSFEEAKGRHAAGLIVPAEYKAAVDDVWANLLKQTGGTRSTNGNVTKDGHAITCEWYNTPLAGSDGKVFGVSSLVEDVTERTQAENAIKESQQKLSLLINSSPLAVIEWNTNFEVVSWNPAAERIFGYSFEEAKGRHAAGLIVPAEYKAAVDDVWANLLKQTGGTRSTNGNVTKDGRAITCEWYNTPLAGPDGKVFGVSSLVEDVTVSRQAEEKALQLQSAVEQTGDGIALADLNGNVLYANPAWAEIHGYTVDEIQGKHLSIFHTREQLEQEVIPFNNKVMEVGKYSSEIGHARKDGSTFPTLMTTVVQKDENGNAVGLIGTIRDITERKEALERLNESEARYQLLSEATIEGIVIHDKGILLDANQTFAKMFGYNQAEVIGTSALNFLTPDSREITSQNIRSGYEKPYDVTGLRKDGSTFPVEITGKAIPYQGLTVRVTALRDITERKQLEREVQEGFERRGYQVQVSTEISQEVAAAFELSDLFARVVTLTKERLGYYHTQLLRYDSSQDAVALVNGYGETGQKMLALGHKMPMGSGLIGTAAESGQTVLRPTLADDPDWKPNPLLPETKGEIAIPIKFGEQILGVLDVQSNQAGALTEDDRLLLEGLCGQIAIAMHNAELVETIRQNESRLAEAAAIAQLGYWEFDMHTDTYTFTDQFYALLRTTAEREGGYKMSSKEYIHKFMHPDDRYMVNSEIQKSIEITDADHIEQFENRFIRADGTEGYVTGRSRVIKDAQGRTVKTIGFNQDITERKQTEARLAEALRTARLANWEYDVEKDIFTFNDQFYAIFHTTAEKAGGYQLSSARYTELFVHPDDLEVVGTEIGKALSSTERVYNTTIDHRIVYEDGGIGYITVQLTVERDENGKITRYYGANQEITERKQAEETLRENEARLAEALKTARLANWEYDVEKDIFTFNDQFYSIFHTTVEKAGGYQLSSARYTELFVHPDDLEVVGTEIGKALSSTERVYNTTIDHRIVYEDGGIGYITVQLTVERDENGKITRYYGANQDITERKQTEEALRRSEQEMAERLEEINRLYQTMSREGWKTYRENEELPAGFVFDRTGTRPVEDELPADAQFANIPMRVLGGEVIGTLAVENDPNQPTSPEDYAFLQQVSDQIALALEGARLSAQTQTALAQSEILFEASRRLAQASNLQELLKAAIETFNIPVINGAELNMFNYDLEGDLESLAVVANWWNGTGKEPGAIGSRYSKAMFSAVKLFLTSTPVFISDTSNNETMDASMQRIVKAFNIHAVTFLPLFVGTHQIGVLVMHAEEPHSFTEEETRLFAGLGPQIATVLDNRRQFERAQQQAERESMLNVISQKIQNATTVEAVLQIAARELGHALGAPMTVAQLSMKDKQ